MGDTLAARLAAVDEMEADVRVKLDDALALADLRGGLLAGWAQVAERGMPAAARRDAQDERDGSSRYSPPPVPPGPIACVRCPSGLLRPGLRRESGAP